MYRNKNGTKIALDTMVYQDNLLKFHIGGMIKVIEFDKLLIPYYNICLEIFH